MIFDFDRFSISAKLAYRQCGGSTYSLGEVLQVFCYYFETYELVFDEVHPFINIQQIANIIAKMPCTQYGVNISPDDYESMIDQHFVTQYRRCDYNINHFFSGQIRDLRYYETLY